MFGLVALVQECYLDLVVLLPVGVYCFVQADLVIGFDCCLQVFFHVFCLFPAVVASAVHLLLLRCCQAFQHPLYPEILSIGESLTDPAPVLDLLLLEHSARHHTLLLLVILGRQAQNVVIS